MRIYDKAGVLKSFCETIPDTNLYDLIKDLETMLEVSEKDNGADEGGRVRSTRIQALTQAILKLSGSMSQVLEVVKGINTDNDRRIQLLSNMELKWERGKSYGYNR